MVRVALLVLCVCKGLQMVWISTHVDKYIFPLNIIDIPPINSFRTCRQLGDMTPAYLPLLLNALLCGIRDPDSYIRASCLSTLGDALEKARYAIGANHALYEILATLSGAAKLDSSPEVRRGAVGVIRNLLRGLGVDAIEALGGEVMKELYRLLKYVYETDRDDATRLQAQLVYEELDVLMRQFLFPEPSLVKKISVLTL